MSQKTQKRFIYWSEDTDTLAQETIQKYSELMRANGISPTTSKNAARDEQLNVSGVIRFALLVTSGKIRLPH